MVGFLDLARRWFALWLLLAAVCVAPGQTRAGDPPPAANDGGTWTLELKRFEPEGLWGSPPSSIYRSVQGQYFFSYFDERADLFGQPEANGRLPAVGQEGTPVPVGLSFPRRGPLGFAGIRLLARRGAAPRRERRQASAGKQAECPHKRSAADSPVARMADRLFQAILPAARPTLDAITYNRLYFDFNHNGDLTDDKVVEANPARFPARTARRAFLRAVRVSAGRSHHRRRGHQARLRVLVARPGHGHAEVQHASIQLNAAAYREGEITLAGKKHHVVLVDFNSNGRFDDQIKSARMSTCPTAGSIPGKATCCWSIPSRTATPDLAFDVSSSNFRNPVSRLIAIDGRCYQLKISPAGDRLTLTPAALPLGKLVNPGDDLHAVLYGDLGFLKIRSDKGKAALVPAGRWNLLSYCLDRSRVVQAAAPPQRTDSWLGSLADKAVATLAGIAGPGPRLRYSLVVARATAPCKPIDVVAGQTAAIRLGPPYKPLVSISPYGPQTPPRVDLELSLLGPAGETSRLVLDFGAPLAQPKFTIRDAHGKVVHEGTFEFGGSFPCRYTWQAPSRRRRNITSTCGWKGSRSPSTRTTIA